MNEKKLKTLAAELAEVRKRSASQLNRYLAWNQRTIISVSIRQSYSANFYTN